MSKSKRVSPKPPKDAGDKSGGSVGTTPDVDKMTDPMDELIRGLVKDLSDLRAKRITNRDAKVRAELAREITRLARLQLDGLVLNKQLIERLPKAGGVDVEG